MNQIMLLLLLIYCISLPPFTLLVEHHGILIRAVRNRIHVGRVFLVHNDEFGFEMMSLGKVLARMNIAAGFLGADTLDGEMIDEIPAPTLFVLMTSDDVMREFLLKVSHHQDTMAGNKWLLLSDYSTDIYASSIVKFFKNVHIPFDCEFLVTEESIGEEVNVRAVYHFHPKLPLRDRHYGTWYRRQEKWIPNGLYKLSRSNLEHLTIKTAYGKFASLFSPNPPFGLFGLIWKSLEQALNFTSEFVLVTDGGYGGQLIGKTWNGIAGSFLRNETTATACNIGMTSERLNVMTFLDPLFQSKKIVFIRKASTYDEIKWHGFTSPFSTKLWLAVIITTASFATSLMIAGRFAPGCKHYPLSEALLIATACFCSQGRDDTPTSWAGRLVFLTCYLTGVIVLAGYSASLISSLASYTETLPFTDFKGMVENGQYQLGFLKGYYLLDYLKSSEDPTMKRVIEELVLPPDKLPESVEKGMQSLCNKKYFAFITDKTGWQLGRYNLTCEVLPIPQAFIPTSLSMALKNYSEYRGLFNSIIRRMRQTGLLDILEKRAIPHAFIQLEDSTPEVTIFNVIPLLSVLMGGIVISWFILLLEIITAKAVAKENNQFHSHTVKVTPLRRHKRRTAFNPISHYGRRRLR